METFTHSEIQNFGTSKLKSIIKNGLVDIETDFLRFSNFVVSHLVPLRT